MSVTVAEAQRWARRRQGLAPAESDALLAAALNCSRLALLADPGRLLAAEQWARFQQDTSDRGRGVPLAYLLGNAPFLAFDFAVGPGILIPRPETEGLVLAARNLALLAHGPAGRLADVGCGSGAIGLSLAAMLPGWQAVLVDQSALACELARENAVRLGVAVEVRQGDLLAPLLGDAPFHLLISNPPYIASAELDGLPADDLRVHEPRLALDGGPDGLAFYRRLAVGAGPLLRPNGHLLLEIGHDQGQTVPALLQQAGSWDAIEVHPDLAGQDRIVIARRQPD